MRSDNCGYQEGNAEEPSDQGSESAGSYDELVWHHTPQLLRELVARVLPERAE